MELRSSIVDLFEHLININVERKWDIFDSSQNDHKVKIIPIIIYIYINILSKDENNSSRSSSEKIKRITRKLC